MITELIKTTIPVNEAEWENAEWNGQIATTNGMLYVDFDFRKEKKIGYIGVVINPKYLEVFKAEEKDDYSEYGFVKIKNKWYKRGYYEDYKYRLRVNQFNIPRNKMWLGQEFGDRLSYNQVIKLYSLAVEKILITYNVETLLDIPYGQGYLLAENLWVSWMKEAIENQKGENKYE